MYEVVDEAPEHIGAREALLDRVFGAARFLKSSDKIRRGRLAADGLSLVACDADAGRLVGTVRLWHVAAGDAGAALLLGPLAVSPDHQGAGLGGMLMRHALLRARLLGHEAVILVGDPEYYARFGFDAEKTAGLAMPGPFERRRLQAVEFRDGKFAGTAGLIRPTGAFAPVHLPLAAAA